MKHKVLKSKGLSLFGHQGRISYGAWVDAIELGPEARQKAMYYVDFRYEPKGGHVWAEISSERNFESDYLGSWHFDMPLGWIPTESQLVQLAEEAVKKYLMGHLKK